MAWSVVSDSIVKKRLATECSEHGENSAFRQMSSGVIGMARNDEFSEPNLMVWSKPMRLVAAGCLLIAGLSATNLEAGETRFPYQARVIAEETWVRSGGGERYYPTQRLTQGQLVTVHRHDPGGWYMIDPPGGSFNWIAERYVERTNATQGVVRDDNVVAFVGSEFGDEVSVWQRRLMAGEVVAIMERRDLETSSGRQSMLKISPPQRERRWIPGVAVVPVDPGQQQLADSDAYRMPSNAAQSGLIKSPTADANSTSESDVPKSPQLLEQERHTTERKQIAVLDQKFRAMVLQDASTWNLDQLEAEYRALQSELTSPSLSAAIELRFAAIRRYQQRMSDARNIRNLQSATERRDASLVSRHGFRSMMSAGISPLSNRVQSRSGIVQREAPGGFPQYMQPGKSESSGTTSAVSTNPGERSVFVEAQQMLPPGTSAVFADQSATPVSETRFDGNVIPASAVEATGDVSQSEAASMLQPGSPQNPFVGAGMLLPADGGADGFVLADGEGNILAELRPAAGVDLQSFAGNPVGVMGTRWSQEDRRDIIEVSGLKAVRLATP